MSTILKALRRLEQEKSSQADRPLNEAVAHTPPPAPRSANPWIVGAVCVAAAFLVTVGAIRLLGSDAAEPAEAPVAAAQAPSANDAGAPIPPPGERTNADRFRLAKQAQEARRAKARAAATGRSDTEPPPAALISDVGVIERPRPEPVEDEATPPEPVLVGRAQPLRPGLKAMRPKNADAAPLPVTSIPRTAAVTSAPTDSPTKAQRLAARQAAAAQADDEARAAASSEPEKAPEPVELAAVEPAPPAIKPAPAPAPAPVPPPPAAEPKPATETASAAPPAPKPAPRRTAAPAKPKPPEVYVARTEWHPIAERRIALVRYGDGGDEVELHEGDVIGLLTVSEIEPTGVSFRFEGSDLRRRVGER